MIWLTLHLISSIMRMKSIGMFVMKDLFYLYGNSALLNFWDASPRNMLLEFVSILLTQVKYFEKFSQRLIERMNFSPISFLLDMFIEFLFFWWFIHILIFVELQETYLILQKSFGYHVACFVYLICEMFYNVDLFGVSYGAYDFIDEREVSGGVCFFSLKNPVAPEFYFQTDYAVMCLDVHSQVCHFSPLFCEENAKSRQKGKFHSLSLSFCFLFLLRFFFLFCFFPHRSFSFLRLLSNHFFFVKINKKSSWCDFGVLTVFFSGLYWTVRWLGDGVWCPTTK